MKTHELKISSKYYRDVVIANKTYELRKDDRNYKVGDLLILKEYDNGSYSGNVFNVTIKHILKNCPEYGLMDGYVILSIL